MRRYFIIGTDTNCGKTYVTCQLLDYLQKRDKRAIAIKPVASGCMEEDGELINEDVLHLQHYNGFPQKIISPWCFKSPVSPHLAAAEEGKVISAQRVAEFCYDKSFDDTDYLLIESAGGLLSPLNSHETWLDVLSYSQIPVILVVGMKLGCLNHALLTTLALKTQGIECVGWIANCFDTDMLVLPENITTLTAKLNWPLLATINYKGQITENLINLL